MIPYQKRAQHEHSDLRSDEHCDLANNYVRQMPMCDLRYFAIERRGGTVRHSSSKLDVLVHPGLDHFVSHIRTDQDKQNGKGDDEFVSKWHRVFLS
jgi:hypothetical protein